MAQAIRRYLKDQSGATSIEYALLAFGIAVAIIVTVNSLGTTVNSSYVSVDNALQ